MRWILQKSEETCRAGALVLVPAPRELPTWAWPGAVFYLIPDHLLSERSGQRHLAH